MTAAGYYLGLIFSVGSILTGESQGWRADLIHVISYGPAAVAILFACGWLARAVVIGRLGLVRELTADRNLGIGFVLSGYLIASGLLIHGILSGSGGGWGSTLVFFALAQAVLLVVGPVYARVVGYGLRQQLTADNAAAGLAYGGCILGIGIILARLLGSDFISWRESLIGFTAYALGGLIALPLVRWLANRILAPGIPFSREITQPDRPNIVAGLLEAVSYVAAGLLVAWSIS